MAHILSVTSGFPSILYPSVELARRLAAAGHRLTFAALPEARPLIEGHGLAFWPLDESRYEEFIAEDGRQSVVHRLLTLRRRRARALDSLAVRGFARALAELEPDLVLIDGEMHEHILVASAVGLRLALLNSFASIWRRPGLPPPHCLVRPGVGWRGSRGGIWLLWLALRMKKWWRAATLRVRRVGCDRLSVLRLLAREVGFEIRRETDSSQWLIPFTYRRIPVLSLHAREFEFPHSPASRVHFVGPLLLKSRADRPLTTADGARLETLFERRRAGGGRRKLIYAGFGSILSTDLAFLRRLVAIVEERPDWELVLSLSDRLAPADLGRLSERVHLFDWVPQMTVVAHADAVVTHGGINTLDECVVAAVPTLIYCGFETDMAGNTARVVHHGIGIAGDRAGDTTATIRAHLDRLLGEPQFVERLRAMRRHYLAYAENRVAEQVVAALLADRREEDPS